METTGQNPTDKQTSVRLHELALCGIASEFARPLDLIEWNRRYLQLHLEKNGEAYSVEKMTQSLEDMGSAIAALNRLADNFVAVCACMSRSVPVQSENLDLAAMLRSLVADSEAIYRAIGVRLTLDCDPAQSWCIRADPALVERVLLNLLSNGLRACSPGESVTFALCRKKDEICLTVTDDGCGITPEEARMAFEPFRERKTIHERFSGGAGMGLYLCGEYCRLLDWEIDIRPQKRGTCVTMRIPDLPGGSDWFSLHSPAAAKSDVSRVALLRELRSVPGLEMLGSTPADRPPFSF